MMRLIISGILVLMAAVMGVIAYQWYDMRFAGKAYGDAFTLVDNKGEAITEKAFRGRPSAEFFGFTHCPEVCPTTLFELGGWLEQLGDEGKDINAYFVTVDPERDTPEIMTNYVSNVSDRITSITGETDKVLAMAKSFGIFWRKVDLEDGDFTMDHTASVILLDGDGDFFGTIAYEETPDTAMAKLKLLAEQG